MRITTCIFDAYGTLFDVNAAARRAAAEPDGAMLSACWPDLARDWRNKQLHYSWLRSVAGHHCDFWQITQDALDWALDAAKLDDPKLRSRLLALYWELDSYPEAPRILAALQDRGLQTAILSNGTPDMLNAAVASAGLKPLLTDVLSAESAGVFKPHSKVYDLVPARFACRPDQVLFVSANGWDAAGAAGYGFRTAWINRAGDPIDRLYAQPTSVLPDLSTVPDLV